MRVIRAIISKEFAEILRNPALIGSSLIPALIFAVLPPLLGLRGARGDGRSGQLSLSQASELVISVSPELRNLPVPTLGQIFAFRQNTVLLLFIPIVTALTIAVHSIIGEKQTRSLEPLLAAPVSSLQVLLAKSLSGAIPALGLTWIVFGFYALTMEFLARPQVLPNVLIPTTWVLMFVICPLIAILGLSLGVIVSSQVNDPRTAQQIAGLLVLPVMGLFIAQIQGLYYLTLSKVLVSVIVLAVIDVIVFKVGVALFDRETILVRWK
jgi:ABC-2 type transport system permease protein